MPLDQLCSDCYLGRLQMMQATRYSAYAAAEFFQYALALAVEVCPGADRGPEPTGTPVRPGDDDVDAVLPNG